MTDKNRVREVFAEVMQVPAAERSAFVEQACAGNAGLLAEVRALLEAMEGAAGAGFFASPTIAQPPSSTPTIIAAPHGSKGSEGPGTVIGPYKLLQLIGEGGFGSVFMAQQDKPVQRRVALKIIKLGMDTKQVVARFEQERQALAVMDHANIAKVLDAGATDNGRPFFVMELVTGEPITDYCDRHSLTISDRLDLFAQVCNAVQHAHHKGIIHRDIKPSNVLVSTQDGKPLAKVIDFGIAKATAARLTEKTLFTEHKTLIGTPEYMSPEQAEGSLDIDTRTDVYSLGVLLYELLTGATPFDSRDLRSAAFGEMQRIIREVDPPKPSTRLSQNTGTMASVAASRRVEPRKLGSIVRGELDWIVMKALEKDRARRYDSANGLAADIQRYLGGDAVVAAPPSAAYRFRKFVRRNKGAVTATAAVAAALLIGVIAFAWQAQVARDERDNARTAQKAEEAQRKAADVQRDRALKAEAETAKRAEELAQVAEFQANQLGDLDPQLMGTRLRNALMQASPEDARAALGEHLARINFTNIAMGSLKENIFDRTLKAIDEQFADQPLVQARLLESVALTLRALGLADRALEPQKQSLEIRRRESGAEDKDTLTSMANVGIVLLDLGRTDEAEPYYTEALDTRLRVLGPDHPDTLNSLNNSAYLLLTKGKNTESEAMYRQALEGRRRVLGDEHRDTLTSVNGTGYALVMQGKLTEAEPYWREAYETGKRILGPEDPDVLVWINNMGGLIGSQGRGKEAEAFYREAMETTRRVHGDEHPATLNCIDNLASNLLQQGRLADSEPLQLEALNTRARVLGAAHPDTLTSKVGLSRLYRSQGRLAEAEPLMREVLDERRRTLGNDHGETIITISMMAGLLKVMDRLDESEALFRESLERSARVLGEDHPDTLVTKNNFGLLLIERDKFEEAQPMLLAALEARQRVSGPTHPETLILLTSVGRVLELTGKLDEAEPYFRQAMEGFEQAVGTDHPNYFNAVNNMALLLEKQGKLDEAQPLMRQSLEGMLRVYGPDHARTGNAHMSLGILLTKMKQFAEAEQELLEADRVYAQAQGVSQGRRTQLIESLIELYESWHAAEPGKGFQAKAEEWTTKLTEPPPQDAAKP